MDWLNGMIECKDCNKRFCEECQDEGFLDFIDQLCEECDEKRIRAALHAESEERRLLDDLWYQVTMKQSMSGVFNECLMDYDFIVEGNEMSKVLKKKYNKNRRKEKSKSYWIRKNDKKGNRKYNERPNQRNLLMFMLKNEI